MAKSVKFARPTKATTPAATADDWVGARKTPTTDKPSEPLKRLTIDIPASLHARVKAGCAMRGVKMADVLRTYLEAEFPDQTTKT